MTVGDALNDIEMIGDAGHGAAMATAPAIVRAAGRYVAVPVERGRRRRPDRGAGPRPARRGAAQRRPARGGGPRRRGRRLMTATRVLPDGDAARAEAVALLRAGRIVAIPTDTVYGIAADLALPDAIERLFAAKRRPPEKAVAVLLADAAQAWSLGVASPAARAARRALLARRPDAGAAGPPRGDAPRCPGGRHPDDRRPRARPCGPAGPGGGPRPAAHDVGQPVRPARRPRRRRGRGDPRRGDRARHRWRPDPRWSRPRPSSTARPIAPRSCDRGRSIRRSWRGPWTRPGSSTRSG